MTVPSLLALARPYFDSLYFVLFLALAIAVVVWLVLRMLATVGGEEGETNSGISTGTEKKPAKEKTAAPAVASEAAETPRSASKPVSSSAESSEVAENSIDTVSEEEAARMFSDELDSGLVTQDPVYGIIYTTPPEDPDDLKKIKGVAKVLEGKLNGIGVYRFKQVAVWTDAACAEFSKLLTFKDRIYRDNWIAQAKAFHEEKYGEKL